MIRSLPIFSLISWPFLSHKTCHSPFTSYYVSFVCLYSCFLSLVCHLLSLSTSHIHPLNSNSFSSLTTSSRNLPQLKPSGKAWCFVWPCLPWFLHTSASTVPTLEHCHPGGWRELAESASFIIPFHPYLSQRGPNFLFPCLVSGRFSSGYKYFKWANIVNEIFKLISLKDCGLCPFLIGTQVEIGMSI